MELEDLVQHSQHQIHGVAREFDAAGDLVPIDLTGATLKLRIQLPDGKSIELAATPDADQVVNKGVWTSDPPSPSPIDQAGRTTVQIWITGADGKDYPAYGEERKIRPSVPAAT